MEIDGRADSAIANRNNAVEQNHSSLFDQCCDFVKEHKAASGIVAAGAVAGIALLTHKFAFAGKAAAIAEDTLGTVGREVGCGVSNIGESPLASRIIWGPELGISGKPVCGVVELGSPVSEEYWERIGIKLSEKDRAIFCVPKSEALPEPAPPAIRFSTPEDFDVRRYVNEILRQKGGIRPPQCFSIGYDEGPFDAAGLERFRQTIRNRFAEPGELHF
jgi:hypothetical protein